MNMDINTLVAIVRTLDDAPTGEEVAEALWVFVRHTSHEHLKAALANANSDTTTSLPQQSSDNSDTTAPLTQLPPEEQDANQTLKSDDNGSPAQKPPGQHIQRASLLASVSKHTHGAGRGIRLNIPGPSPLPDVLNITRALRPLRCRVNSQTSIEIDEMATAQRSAEARRLIPVLRPERRRWLSLDVIIDESSSMDIWHATVSEFIHLLERLGAFRNVRQWRMNAMKVDQKPQLFSSSGRGVYRQSHPINELIDPGGQKLILIISDCVAAGWHSGRVAEMITHWTKSEPVAIVQVLPEWLWSRTSLNREVGIEIRNRMRGGTNSQLDIRLNDDWIDDSDQVSANIPIPVIPLDAAAMKEWAQFLIGTPDIWISGKLLVTTIRSLPFLPQSRSIPAEERIRAYVANASPEAQVLARRLAIAPLTLPVIYEVQRATEAQPVQAHIAEFLFGGLVYRVPSPSPQTEIEEILFEFYPGVREKLIAHLKLSDSYPVLEAVSSYIEQARQMRLMRAGILDSKDNTDEIAVIEERPFAYARAMLLKSLGYRQIAEQLEQQLDAQYNNTTANDYIQLKASPDLHQTKDSFNTTQDKDRLWMLDPLTSLSAKRVEQWAELCFQPAPVDQLLADPNRSVVVLTTPGCGMSTSLSLLPRSGLLTLDYPPERWPGVSGAFTRAESHFSQWMGLIAQRLCEQLGEHPHQIRQLNRSHHEFLAWIIRKYISSDEGSLWLSQLHEQLSEADYAKIQTTIDSGELDESYTNTGSGLIGQIEESLQIAQRLGYRGIFATIKIDWGEWLHRDPDQRAALTAGVRQLLSTLILLQRRGFGMKVGLPVALGLSVAEVEQLVRGRATVTAYDWSEAEIIQIVQRLTSAASAGAVSAEPWCSPEVWAMIWANLRAIWGSPGPGAATALARTIIEHSAQRVVDAETIQSLRRKLYTRYAPIWLDPDLSQRTVWRGMQPITLEEAPFSLFQILWGERGNPIETTRLRQHMGNSQPNLDKNISLIRKRLEPFFKDGDYLYLQRNMGRGIWIENFTDGTAPV